MTELVSVSPAVRPIAGLMSHCGTSLIGRQDLLGLPTPDATDTHKPIAHAVLVGALIEALGYRRLNVVQDQYAVSPDGMRLFGVLALDIEENGVRVSIGIRNSHDKSYSVGITIGYKVFVCDNLAFHGDFQTLTRKHSKNLVIEDVFSVAVDRMHRNFAPMLNQVNAWRGYELPDAAAKLLIYRAFIEDDLPVPKHLAKDVHRHYFEPEYEEFQSRTMWSLIERVHLGLQGAGSGPALPGHGEARGVSRECRLMDLMEEDCLRRQLARFLGSEETYHHPSHALRYTAGVRFLAERCGLFWLIDLIAAWQWRALREPDLAVIQFWELRPIGSRRVLLCTRDSESLVFALPVVHRSPLDYLSLYVEIGVLMLPSEKSKAPP